MITERAFSALRSPRHLPRAPLRLPWATYLKGFQPSKNLNSIVQANGKKARGGANAGLFF